MVAEDWPMIFGCYSINGVRLDNRNELARPGVGPALECDQTNVVQSDTLQQCAFSDRGTNKTVKTKTRAAVDSPAQAETTQ